MINENTLDSQQIERLQQIALNTQKVRSALLMGGGITERSR